MKNKHQQHMDTNYSFGQILKRIFLMIVLLSPLLLYIGISYGLQSAAPTEKAHGYIGMD